MLKSVIKTAADQSISVIQVLWITADEYTSYQYLI